MHSRFFAILMIAALAAGAAPSTNTTGPSTDPSTQAADGASPKSSLKAYNLAMRNGDLATMMALQHAVTEDEKHVARCGCQADLQVAALEQAARDKFGEDGEKRIALALDDLDDAAIDAAHESVTGHHAAVTFADNGPPIPMVRSSARWAVDIAETLKMFHGTPDDFCDGVIRKGSAAKVTAQQIIAGQFPTVAAAIESLKSRLKES